MRVWTRRKAIKNSRYIQGHKYLFTDDGKIIDLTMWFGTNKEPTKQEMKKYFSKNYIEYKGD